MKVPENYDGFGHLSDAQLQKEIAKELLSHAFEDGWFHNVARFDHSKLRPLLSKRRLHQMEQALKRRHMPNDER